VQSCAPASDLGKEALGRLSGLTANSVATIDSTWKT